MKLSSVSSVCDVTDDLEVNQICYSSMNFPGLSIAVFAFPIRCVVSELWGLEIPPPPAAGGWRVGPVAAGFKNQGRRHGFLSRGSNRRQGGQPTPKYPKNRKKHRILATSFTNLGGRTARFPKVRGSGPPDPPVGDAPVKNPTQVGFSNPISGRGLFLSTPRAFLKYLPNGLS